MERYNGCRWSVFRHKKNLPPNKNSYNPRKLLVWGQSAQTFYDKVPNSLREIAENLKNIPQGTQPQAETALLQARSGLDDFLTRGSDVIMGQVYGQWATMNGLTFRSQGQFQVESPITFNQLDAGRQFAWNTYVGTTELPREMSLSIVAKLLAMIPNPYSRHVVDPSLDSIMRKLSKAKYQLVTSVFPDLNDDEAKKLFGQLTTASEVFDKARTE